MNRDVIWCVVLLIILCLSAAVASVLWERETSSVVWTDWYNKKGGDVEESRNNFSAGFFIFLTMVILLQILIPISLYVSIELVKLAQVIIL
jgi:phospholipid-translocating ATPase